MASSEERLKTDEVAVEEEPMTPPRATVSNAHIFHTTIPTNRIAERVSIASQSRRGSRCAPRCKRLKKEMMGRSICILWRRGRGSRCRLLSTRHGFRRYRSDGQFKIGTPRIFTIPSDGE